MARKKSQSRQSSHSTLISVEGSNIFIAGVLIAFGILIFFAENGDSVVGRVLRENGEELVGGYYRFILSIIPFLLGMMILMRRASWSFWRAVWIILSWISLTTIIGFIEKPPVLPLIDFHIPLERYLWGVPAVIFSLALFGVALWMTLRISYRTLLRNIHEKIVAPSVASIRDVTFSSGSDDRVITKSDKYKDQVRELEGKLEKISKERETDEQKKTSPPPPKKEEKKSWLFGAFSRSPVIDAITTKVPIDVKKRWEEKWENGTKPLLDFGTWDFPTAKLLNEIHHLHVVTDAEIEEKSLIIQKTFLQFGIEVSMMEEAIWPTVVQYRILPEEWVKLSKIMALKDNLTLALKAKSIRIQAPIPGMGLVGIEVPNEKRDIVGIRELLSDDVFTRSKSKLSLAIGKDINGDYVVGDLGKMPHLLIAWQTWSGKSVGMNGFLLSLLFKNTPNDLRLIMVDPKQVELGIYDGIPHLLTPVINSPDKALNALRWSVTEMERRYSTFKPYNVRNLEEYNAKVGRKEQMPVIVIVIDELADLMMSGNKKEVESAIMRIAQKARATGMHLILATQRPSVNVITGTIKANIPSRIAFTVASQIDSRTILDTMGAEDLLGRGDMLYFPTGAMTQTRLQWVLVETDEVERVVKHIKLTIDPEMLEDLYDASIVEWDRGNWEWSAWGEGRGWNDEDPKVIEAAIELVRGNGKCSTSMLQRHLKLGYGRAARVVDVLEEMGIIWPADWSKPRDVIG